MKTLSKEQVKEIIPLRDPMLLVDEVLELVPGEKNRQRYSHMYR